MGSADLGLRVVILGVGEARRNMGAVNNDLNTLTTNFEKAAGVSSTLATRLSALGSGMAHLGRTMSLTLTLPIAAFGAGMLKAGIDFEDAFAGVSKTVEGVSDNFGNLTKLGQQIRTEFRQLALEIPTSAVELARIGEEAGALGVPATQITEFVKIVAQLGVATNVSADEAGNAIARFANIMGVSSEDLAAFAKSAGSAIVDLGNKSAATESEIIAMAYRLAGAGKAVGLTSQEIIGLSTSISELGVRAEQGGSAVSRILLQMYTAASEGGESLDLFAKAAGVTSDEFRNLVKSSPIKAFQILTSGLARMQEEGTLTTDVLNDLELNTIRLRDVVNRFGPDMGSLTTNINNANKAWAEGTALEIEAQKRYNTIASQIQLLKNAFAELGIVIFDLYRDDISRLIKAFGTFVKGLGKTKSEVIRTAAKIAVLAAAIGPLLVIAGSLVQVVALATTGLKVLKVAAISLASPWLIAAAAVGVLAYAIGDALDIKLSKGIKKIVELSGWVEKAFNWGKDQKGGNILSGIGSAFRSLTYIYKDHKRTFYSEVLKAFGMGDKQAEKFGMQIRNFVAPAMFYLSNTFNRLSKTLPNVAGWLGKAFNAGKNIGGGNIFSGIAFGLKALTYVYDDAKRTFFSEILKAFGLGEEQANKFGMKIRDFLTPILMKLATAFFIVANTVETVILQLNQGDWLAAITATLAGLARLFGASSEEAFAFAGSVIEIGRAIVNAIGSVANFAQNLKTAFDEEGLKGVGKFLLDAIAGGLSDLAGWIYDSLVVPLGEELKKITWDDVEDVATSILDGIKKGFSEVGSWVLDNLVIPFIDSAKNLVENNPDALFKLGEVAGGILRGIASGFVDLLTWVWDKLISPLFDDTQTTVDGAEAGTKGKYAGESILRNIAYGFADLIKWVLEKITLPIAAGIVSGLFDGNVQKKLAEFGPKLLEALKKGFLNVGQWTIDNIIDPILDKFTNLPGWIVDAIKNAISGGGELVWGKLAPSVSQGPVGAKGGNVTGPTVVGEKGKELFMPQTSGFLLSNNMLKNIANIMSSSVMARGNSNYINKSVTYSTNISGVPMTNERSAADEMYRVYQMNQMVYGQTS